MAWGWLDAGVSARGGRGFAGGLKVARYLVGHEGREAASMSYGS